MDKPITITLPPDLKAALDDLSRKEGIPADEVVGRAIKQRFFLQQFRSLRERLSAKAKAQGIACDQDVFDRVS
jgi:hypothetical protein